MKSAIKKFVVERLSFMKPIYRVNHGFCDVYTVPMFSDNYGYIIVDKSSQKVACVDPAEAKAIINALNELNLKLDYIFITHKHEDHVGGNIELKQAYQDVQIYGTQYEHVPVLDHPVGQGSVFKFGDIDVRVQHTPCHTTGHIVYLLTSSSHEYDPVLFPGDTLFVGGCGRFFEGTGEDMLKNMNYFSTLPASTAVYCAHEYTEGNYRFLTHVDDTTCGEKYNEIKQTRAEGLPTVPSSIEAEQSTNLFMKCNEENIQRIVNTIGSPVDTMNKLRQLKNSF